jgi:hypothetical protein
MKPKKLTLERLKETIHYDPSIGILTRLIRMSSNAPVGQNYWVPNKGYFLIKIDGVRYFAHHLAWFYMTGKWPHPQVDHEDRDRGNNKWNNLRLGTQSQNMANAGKRSNNKSGHKGVHWHKQNNKWAVQIGMNSKRFHVGVFDDLEEAVSAYAEAARQRYGEFARSA